MGISAGIKVCPGVDIVIADTVEDFSNMIENLSRVFDFSDWMAEQQRLPVRRKFDRKTQYSDWNVIFFGQSILSAMI